MVRAAVDTHGRLDVLVNSAGVSGRNALPESANPEEVWDRVIDVNLKGTYLVSWYAVPEMERTGGGSIINLSSIMGLVGYNFLNWAATSFNGGDVDFSKGRFMNENEDGFESRMMVNMGYKDEKGRVVYNRLGKQFREPGDFIVSLKSEERRVG